MADALTDPELWQAWRRPRDSRQAWEKVPGMEPTTKSAAFHAVQGQHWLASEIEWEYTILPVGRIPQERRFGGEQGRRGTFYEGYKTRVMRPHGK